jgi:YD repeat-containing protein
MLGASSFTPPRAKLAAFSFTVESRAQAQAIQNFLWCLWFAALNAPETTTTPRSTKTANAKGLVAVVNTLPLATQITYAYDAIGNLTQVVSPGAGTGTGTASTITKTMTYDRRGVPSTRPTSPTLTI